jgi:FtsP/CotA-like multicopper oxidase with cupredoxin domain
MMRRVCSAILIIVLGLALATPARANTLDDDARNIIIGVVAVTAAIAVLVTVLIIRHNSPKSTITGCVQSGTNGMSLTDEKNGLNYTLAGSTIGVKPGDRVTLKGKRKDIGTTVGFEARRIEKDFGACQP